MEPPPGWLTKDALFACLEAKGVNGINDGQLARWRREGLLPRAKQVPVGYRGSIVLFPPDTCNQVVAIRALLGEKRKFEHVGWELWWQGYDVNETYWKPVLQQVATAGDRLLKLLRWQIVKDERHDRRMKAAFVLVWMKLRKVSNDLSSSSEIAQRAASAEQVCALAEQLKVLRRSDQRLASVLHPKRIRKALSDERTFLQFLDKIQRARLTSRFIEGTSVDASTRHFHG